jgi:predicted ATPase/class 3 adenylate cyclase
MESDIARQAGLTTFLFSDIESSTRRWEKDSDGMAADLAVHDQLLRRAVESVGGEVFSHTGDGMVAAFVQPGAALQAAVVGQLSLSATAWSCKSPLRVRMAVHTGRAQRRGANYFGPTLNRAARLMAVGSGGQVLCSQATADLVSAGLPASVALVDLGEHRLADLTRPERVFQVMHPELRSTFPALRSLGAYRHNLPIALTSFVGRTDEVKTVEDVLDRNRLVTLTGIGGTGKTRLALQVAAEVVERFPDGVWLIELARIRDDGQVVPAVAAALGVDIMGITSADAVADHLCAHLAAKRTLLVFDNCEHLVDMAAKFIYQLLTRCSAVTVIATSRENLRLPGEVTWRVPPLSLPPTDPRDVAALLDSDAVLFFCERARAARPTFELSRAHATSVARICRRVDGIPLALELAAARIRVLSVRQIAERLEDCFQVLTGGPRTSLPHHQTLRAALDWSYDLLSDVERAALRRLAVFPTGFRLDAAEVVMLAGEGAEPTAGGEFDPVNLIERLVDQSWVVVSEDGSEDLRYRLLEPVRQYARERLAATGEEPMALRRHRDFFLALTAQWGNRLFSKERWIGVTADIESFRSALEWSWQQGDFEASLHLVAALWLHWLFGNRTGARQWLERVVDRTQNVLHPARAEVLCALTKFLPGDTVRQQALIAEAAELLQRIDDQHGLAAFEYVAGEAALRSGSFGQARSALDSALARYEALEYDTGISECHAQLGWVAVGENDLDLARAHFQRATELAAERDDEPVVAQALSALAALHVVTGDIDGGFRLATDAIASAERSPLRMVLVMALIRAGETALLSADRDRACQFLTDGLACIAELGTERYLGDCCELVALLQLARGDPRAAAVMFGASSAVYERTGGASEVRFIAKQARAGHHRLADILGSERLERYEREGRKLSRDQVIDYARSCVALRLFPENRQQSEQNLPDKKSGTRAST